MDDDQIIAHRIAGKSVRAIAKLQGRSVAEVNTAIDRWAEQAIDDKLRKNTLALDLARLDELQETFYRAALAGDVQSGLLVTKLIERRCVMLGLHSPQQATLQIIDNAAPRLSTTHRIEAAIESLLADGRKDDDPTTH